MSAAAPTLYGDQDKSAWFKPPTANNCSPINNPATITKNQGTAITWTNGVKIKSVIGIDLSVKAGFTGRQDKAGVFSYDYFLDF